MIGQNGIQINILFLINSNDYSNVKNLKLVLMILVELRLFPAVEITRPNFLVVVEITNDESKSRKFGIL